MGGTPKHARQTKKRRKNKRVRDKNVSNMPTKRATWLSPLGFDVETNEVKQWPKLFPKI
jgi:hypothetical protein